jgi:hypothetical protein
LNGLESWWVQILWSLMKFLEIKVPATPESTTAVVSMVFR